MTTLDRLLGTPRFLASPDAPSRALLGLRAGVGPVFVVSGIVKFLFDNQGAGRFAKLGFSPGVAAFVGAVEIVGGLAISLGILTRIAAAVLALDMVVAVVTTKLPILFGAPPEPIAALPKLGFWAFAYQARLDLLLLLACGAVLTAGAGAFSLDALLLRKRDEPARSSAELSTT